MLKNLLIVAALALTVALPFALRTRTPAPDRADETLVIITPHNEAIRQEFGRGFEEWYRARTGRSVFLDWRTIGGTSEIARYLDSEYLASFRNLWTKKGRPWSAEIQAGFANGRLPADAPAVVRQARAEFLASEVGCGVDLFFGGGTFDFERQAQAGSLVDCGILQKHPEWFGDDVIPQHYAGEEYWDPEGRWIGTVLSSYGILSNHDALARLGVLPEPRQWEDLQNPRLAGEVALADPTKSGSMAKAFENVIQQQMQRRLRALQAADPAGDARKIETQAVREGWIEGLRLLQLIGANARYFTDSAQKVPVDVAQGTAAAGMCIDFYGRQQEDALRRRGPSARLAYVSPEGGTVNSVDPIGLLRGAGHRGVAVAFIEYVLSMEGQKLWNFRPGTPGGPRQFALRRLPVRRDFYARSEWTALRSDPGVTPYDQPEPLIYHPAWTGGLFREMVFIIRVMCLDPHPELAAAWREIIKAGRPPQALAVLGDLSAVSYEEAGGTIRRALNSRNKVDEITLAGRQGRQFRQQYLKAAELARAGR